MKKGHFYVAIGLLIAVILSGVGVVYSKYQSRLLFNELEKNRKQQDAIEAEWGRLQLELSTRTNYNGIEKIAIEKLYLHRPKAAEISIIESK